jgi:NAD+ kinase
VPENIAVVANTNKPAARRLAQMVARDFKDNPQYRVVLSEDYDDDLSRQDFILLVVFGGDGTVLGAVSRFRGDSVPPVLAFNLGRLGYLAGNSPKGVVKKIRDALKNKLAGSNRLMLKILLPRQKKTALFALNEVVLSPAQHGRMIPLQVTVNGEEVMYTRGDGVIVATPTGSTAYALSVGGPIASPELEAMIIAHICPHLLANRPLVLGPRDRICLVHHADGPAELILDGFNRQQVEPGEITEVMAAPTKVCLLSPPTGRFAIFREKLGWSFEKGRFPLKP